jgi:hypothetical protein
MAVTASISMSVNARLRRRREPAGAGDGWTLGAAVSVPKGAIGVTWPGDDGRTRKCRPRFRGHQARGRPGDDTRRAEVWRNAPNVATFRAVPDTSGGP